MTSELASQPYAWLYVGVQRSEVISIHVPTDLISVWLAHLPINIPALFENFSLHCSNYQTFHDIWTQQNIITVKVFELTVKWCMILSEAHQHCQVRALGTSHTHIELLWNYKLSMNFELIVNVELWGK